LEGPGREEGGGGGERGLFELIQAVQIDHELHFLG